MSNKLYDDYMTKRGRCVLNICIFTRRIRYTCLNYISVLFCATILIGHPGPAHATITDMTRASDIGHVVTRMYNDKQVRIGHATGKYGSKAVCGHCCSRLAIISTQSDQKLHCPH